MRSNGAVHVGNDTFLAATKDVTDSLFLFSSSFPTEEQLASLPLARHVRFNPHSALHCSASELQHYNTAAALREVSRNAPVSLVSPSTKTKNDNQGSTAAMEELTSPLFRHSLHASPDGRQIAVISNVLRHHYIIDIAAEPASVCALEMTEVVRSVCWHPVAQHVLYVLFVSGDMVIYDTSRSRMGVVLPRHRRLALRPIIQRCLAEAEELANRGEHKELPSPSLTNTPATPVIVSGTFAKAIASTAAKKAKGNKTGNSTASSSGNQNKCSAEKSTMNNSNTLAAPLTFVSPSVYYPTRDVDNNNAAPTHKMRTTGSPTAEMAGTASPSKATEGEGKSSNEIIPTHKEPEGGPIAVAAPPSQETNTDVASTGVSNAVHRRTAQTDLVDLYVLAPTISLPVIMLVLSSSGDVYAVHLSEENTLPVLATAAAIDDGRMRTFEEECKRPAGAAKTATAINVEVHHLIAGELRSGLDEALAVRACLVDRDAGTHAVFFSTANGAVLGAWVGEPDLLARHRTAHLRSSGAPNIAFTVRLDGRGGDVRKCLSPAVPSTSHAVTMTQFNNLCLLRCGEMGDVAYLLAMPCWDRERHGWSCWQPTCESAETTTEMRQALPLLSCDAAVPPPVALRLPYDTSGASLALGVQELLLMPELSLSKPGNCERHCILSITLLSLLRSALYARCGTLQLHPPSGLPKVPEAATMTTSTQAQGPQQQQLTTRVQSNGANASRAALLRLVNLIPACHRRWLCGAPQDEVDAATVELATLVERQTREMERRERAQAQRRKRLMSRVAVLESRMSEMNATYDRWQQTLLDAIVHRRGSAAVRTANERLGEVHTMLNEWEHRLY